MENAEQVVEYLDALASKLMELGVTAPFHILVSGGVYMMLQIISQRRATEDIDFALIASPRTLKPNEVFRTTVQRGEVASLKSTIPGAGEFRQAIATVAAEYGLPLDWINDESAIYLYDDAPGVDAYLWGSFSNVLHVYLPKMEYVFALKIAAYRRKDLNDIQVLIRELNIRTREEAQAVVDTYLLKEAQVFWEVPKKLKRLFR